MRILVAIAVTLLTFGAASAQDVELGNDDARKGIEGYWNKLTSNLMIGERTAAKDLPPQLCTSDRMNLEQFSYLLDAQKAGYVDIAYAKAFRDFTKGKTLARDEILALAADGKVGRFTVLPTKKADSAKVGLEIRGRIGCLSFRAGTYTVNQITGNEPRRAGDRLFRVISLSYRVEPTPLVRDVQAAANIRRDAERKANVLIVYDPVRKNWDVAAFDAANANEEITTRNVDAYLARQ